LGHVGASGDVNQIFLSSRVERISASEFEESLVDALEIPRVAELDLVSPDHGFRGYGGDVFYHAIRKRFVTNAVKQLQAFDKEVWLAANGHGRPPTLPAVLETTQVEGGPEKPDNDEGLIAHIR
jgi:hypothetical protein